MKAVAYHTQKKMNLPLRFFGLTSEQWLYAMLVPAVMLLINKWSVLFCLPIELISINGIRREQEKLDNSIDYLTGSWVYARSPKHIIDHSHVLNLLMK